MKADLGIERWQGSRHGLIIPIETLVRRSRDTELRGQVAEGQREQICFILPFPSGRGGADLGKTLGSWGSFGDGLETEKRLIAGGRCDAQDCSHRQISEFSVPAARGVEDPLEGGCEDCCFCCAGTIAVGR